MSRLLSRHVLSPRSLFVVSLSCPFPSFVVSFPRLVYPIPLSRLSHPLICLSSSRSIPSRLGLAGLVPSSVVSYQLFPRTVDDVEVDGKPVFMSRLVVRRLLSHFSFIVSFLLSFTVLFLLSFVALFLLSSRLLPMSHLLI